jgi:hypothetical protein
MTKIPIEHSILKVEEILSNGSGRFTADEVEAFENILQVLKNPDDIPAQKQAVVSKLAIQFFRSFLLHELFKELEHFLKS